ALPVFSAPRGVSVEPSLARSAEDSSATAGTANAAPNARAAIDLRESMGSSLERIADAERIEIAILERVRVRAEARGLPGGHRCACVRPALRAASQESRVLRVDDPLALVIPRHAGGVRLHALVEARAHAAHVVRERDPRRDVAAQEEVRIFEAPGKAIAPRGA